MKPNTRLSMALIFGLLTVLVILLLNSGWIKDTSVNRTPTITPRPSFLDVSANDITQIQVVDSKTGQRFVAQRGDDLLWSVEQAPESPNSALGVDQTRIDNAIAILAAVTTNRSFSQIEALAQYGLDNPVYEIIISENGQDTSITVGSKTIEETSYYTTRTGSSDIFLISTYNLDSLIEFLTDPPYLTPTPGTGTPEDFLPTETPESGTSEPTETPTTEPTLKINITVQFTPRATSTPTPTITPTPSKTGTPTPTGSATKSP